MKKRHLDTAIFGDPAPDPTPGMNRRAPQRWHQASTAANVDALNAAVSRGDAEWS